MKNMFYNYDNISTTNIDTYLCSNKQEPTEYIFSIKNEPVGISVQQNNSFVLYFPVYIDTINSEDLAILMTKNIYLDILDFTYESKAVLEATVDLEQQELFVIVDLSTLSLLPGLYKLGLFYNKETEELDTSIKINLFNISANLLEIR